MPKDAKTYGGRLQPEQSPAHEWWFYDSDTEDTVSLPRDLAKTEHEAAQILLWSIGQERRAFRAGLQAGRCAMAADLRRLIHEGAP